MQKIMLLVVYKYITLCILDIYLELNTAKTAWSDYNNGFNLKTPDSDSSCFIHRCSVRSINAMKDSRLNALNLINHVVRAHLQSSLHMQSSGVCH